MNKKAAENIELSIVMPCLNEAETVGKCVANAKVFLEKNGVSGEVIVADNGSIDNSAVIAENAGATVIHVPDKGYGSALKGGIDTARGKYIIIGDSDSSYDFSNLMPFLENLRDGYDIVMGNRFKGGIKRGAMPWHHKYIGNPFLSGIGKLFFKSDVNDFHSGLRGFTRTAYKRMDLRTQGMEFASEMVVKASMYGMKIREVPIMLFPDGRSGKPHLRSFRDGWRHLKFLFLYSPRWLFFYPGLILMFGGILSMLWILFQPQLKWDIHTMLYSSASTLIGFQAVTFAVLSKTFAVHEKLIPSNVIIEKVLQLVTPDRGLLIGLIIVIFGIAATIYTIVIWQDGTFFQLGIRITMRYVIASATLLILGFQMIFSSFFFHMLKLNTN